MDEASFDRVARDELHALENAFAEIDPDDVAHKVICGLNAQRSTLNAQRSMAEGPCAHASRLFVYVQACYNDLIQ